MDKKRKWLMATLAILGATALICALAFILGTHKADADAMMYLTDTDWVTVEQHDDMIAFIPEEVQGGFILYPEDRVEPAAYAPMLSELAHGNILCVVVRMPMGFPGLDVDAAEGIRERYPQVENWYIGGHGAGAEAVADYVSGHTADFKGLVLLAGYSKADLKYSGLEVLTVYGDRDKILNKGRYEKGLARLPEGYDEDVLEGGNHAYFASCGEMPGDGESFLSPYVQGKAAAQAIWDLIVE